MKPTQRSYTNETDLDAILALKQVSTTLQNIYDPPTLSDLRRLLTPIVGHTMLTRGKPSPTGCATRYTLKRDGSLPSFVLLCFLLRKCFSRLVSSKQAM